MSINRFRIYGREEKCADGDLCYYEDVEAILNSAQLLKAEITECADDLLAVGCRTFRDTERLNSAIVKLRQLSAVHKALTEI